MEIILIEWYDSRSRSGWNSKGNLPSTRPAITSAGIKLNENENEVVICHSLDQDFVNSSLAIPKCSIKRIRKLKVVRR